LAQKHKIVSVIYDYTVTISWKIYKSNATLIFFSGCDNVRDGVFGIPGTTTISKYFFEEIKEFFKKLASLIQLGSTKTHYGIVRYSDTANISLRLDEIYQLQTLKSYIDGMQQQGTIVMYLSIVFSRGGGGEEQC